MKRMFLILLCTASAGFSFAQEAPVIGFKGGLNIANVNIEDFDNTDSRIGVHLGALAHIHLTRQLALQPELIYSMEGGKARNLARPGDKATYKNDYINIPVMLQYMFDNGFRIEAGPQLGVLVSSKVEDQNGNEDDADDVFKSTNVSLGVGLNYLTYSGFGVGGRYNLGLSKIGEGARDVRGNVFQISLFYMLDSRHKARSR